MNQKSFTDQQRREARFAELLSRGEDIPDIRRAMNITVGQSSRCMANIKKALGWQAQ